MAVDENFKGTFDDMMSDAAEKVQKRSSFSETLPKGLHDIPGVISYVTVKETKTGRQRLSFKIVNDAGKNQGGYAWGSCTYNPESDGSLRYVARLLSSVGVPASELFKHVESRDDAEGVTRTLANVLLGKRVRFTTTESDSGYIEASFLGSIGDRDPAPEIEVKVAEAPTFEGMEPQAAGAQLLQPQAPKSTPGRAAL